MFKLISAFIDGFKSDRQRRQPMTVKLANRDLKTIAASYNEHQQINSVADLNQVNRQQYIKRLATGSDRQKAIANAYASSLGKRSYVNLSASELAYLVTNSPDLWILF